MAEEFVDLYEILELPLDADRNTLRKRINEMYLDAQRNLDHRNFQTRVHYQKLFEITLPQARYILLDEGRRADYDRLVASFRAAGTSGGPPPPSVPSEAPAPVDPSLPQAGRAPEVSPLPAMTPVDPAKLAAEREELWSKWKTGLEAAVKTDDAPKDTPKSRASAPAPRETPREAPAPRGRVKPADPEPPVNFDFSTKTEAASSSPRPQTTGGRTSNRTPAGNPILPPRARPRDEDPELSAEAAERRRDHRRREIIKEQLVTVGMTWGAIGAAVVLIPGLLLMLGLSSVLYPGVGNPRIPIPQPVFFLIGFAVFTLGAFFTGNALSKKKRRQTVADLSSLPVEELVRKLGRS